MRRENRLVGGLTLSAFLIGASLMARKGTERTWSMVTNEPPPKDQGNRDVDLSEAVLWAVASGAAVGLARLLVRRTLGYRGSPLDDGPRLERDVHLSELTPE